MPCSAVVYSSPHAVTDPCGWYTPIVPCSTAPPSRSEVTATCGSYGTLSNLTTSGTRLTSASRAGPASTNNTMVHSARPHNALQALSNAAPLYNPRRRRVKAAAGVRSEKGGSHRIFLLPMPISQQEHQGSAVDERHGQSRAIRILVVFRVPAYHIGIARGGLPRALGGLLVPHRVN